MKRISIKLFPSELKELKEEKLKQHKSYKNTIMNLLHECKRHRLEENK
jgi:hypothetical protein